MVVPDYPYRGMTDKIRHYSNNGMLIRQVDTDELYEDAVDVYPTPHTYVETDELIPAPPGDSDLI